MTGRNILVVGGTGFIGGHATAHLSQLGDRVTVTSRTPRTDDAPLANGAADQIALDYTEPGPGIEKVLSAFDAVVFAAGNDIRHVAADDEDDAFWAKVQSVGVPRFAALARDAGVGRFIQVGSYYHQVDPAFTVGNPYVSARRDADEGTRALTTDGFAAITLNPPSIVGTSPGRVTRRFARMVAWARGELDGVDTFAPTGGTNYLSVHSLAQAIAGALDNGEPGRAYLVGDENLTYQQFFQLFADESGSDVVFQERDEESPFQPDRFIVQGRGAVITVDPDPAEVALLGYDRHDVRRAVREIVEAVDLSAK